MVNTELIIDLIKLYKKYGSRAFEDLIASLKSQDDINNIILILENSQKLAEKIKSPIRKKTITTSSPKILDIIKITDPEKFELLNEFYKNLISKHSFSSLKEIRFFREDNNLSPLKSKSYNDAVKSLIIDLAQFPTEKLQKLKISEINQNQGLKGWTDIILKKKH